jgi:hypothetical protein
MLASILEGLGDIGIGLFLQRLLLDDRYFTTDFLDISTFGNLSFFITLLLLFASFRVVLSK